MLLEDNFLQAEDICSARRNEFFNDRLSCFPIQVLVFTMCKRVPRLLFDSDITRSEEVPCRELQLRATRLCFFALSMFGLFDNFSLKSRENG